MAREEATERSSAFATPSLSVAALIVATGFMGSRLLGLLRSVIIAQAFGTRPELDAYWVAFRLPDVVFQLLAGATLASAFIPTFAGVRARKGDEAAWKLASSVLNFVLAATVVFALIAFALAPKIVPLLAPGLKDESTPGTDLEALAVNLTRVMLISPVLFAVSGMFMGILNAKRHFLTPALAPMFYNVAIIAAALISHDIHALAIGVVVGAALHLAVQLPDLHFAGMVFSFVADWRDRAVREVGTLMAPRVLGLAATQVNFYFIGIFFASSLGSGVISSLTFAWLMMMTPLGIIGMAISTAAFPTLAEQAARGEAALASTLRSTLRLIIFLSLPAGVGLALLAKPLIVVLLQRGAFDVQSSDITAQALMFYAPALFAHCGIEICSRGFYATGDTRTPVGFAVLSMLINLMLAALLVGPLEVRGIALALSLATCVEFFSLLLTLSSRVPDLLDESLAEGLARMAFATLLMGLVAGGTLLLLHHGLDLSLVIGPQALLIVLASAAAGAGVYVLAAEALGLDEPHVMLRRVPVLRGLVR